MPSPRSAAFSKGWLGRKLNLKPGFPRRSPATSKSLPFNYKLGPRRSTSVAKPRLRGRGLGAVTGLGGRGRASPPVLPLEQRSPTSQASRPSLLFMVLGCHLQAPGPNSRPKAGTPGLCWSGVRPAPCSGSGAAAGWPWTLDGVGEGCSRFLTDPRPRKDLAGGRKEAPEEMEAQAGPA